MSARYMPVFNSLPGGQDIPLIPLIGVILLVFPLSLLASRFIHITAPKTATVGPPTNTDLDHGRCLAEIMTPQGFHETYIALQTLVAKDGAGGWPPRVSRGPTWPAPLHPYHDTFQALVRSLPYPEYMDDDAANYTRCLRYRKDMKDSLRGSVNLAEVRSILSQPDDKGALSPAAWNGFFACISFCRHAYRWGSNPVVRVMQRETIIDMPPELEIPWSLLCRRYGIDSPGGNLTSLFVYNVDGTGQVIYSPNLGASDTVRESEYHFIKVVADMEKQAVPMYLHIVKSIQAYERGDYETCIRSIDCVYASLRQALKVYYDTMTSEKVNPAIWGTFIQGFYGWAACATSGDDKQTIYDGVSGSHTLYTQVIDAFLGMEVYMDMDSILQHIPVAQRDFLSSVTRHCFRHKAIRDNPNVEARMLRIVKMMRTFRGVHRKRFRPYIDAPTPERKIMTAGKSIIENEERRTRLLAAEYLDSYLVKRIEQTK